MQLRDPREAQLTGMVGEVPLYPLRAGALPVGVRCEVGVSFVGGEPRVFAARLELAEGQGLPQLQARRLLAQVHRALVGAVEDGAAHAAAHMLGGADLPEMLPANRTKSKAEVVCFWARRAQHEEPILAIRSHFDTKNVLKTVLVQATGWRQNGEKLERYGWWAEAKVWWVAGLGNAPWVLGQLRRNGYKLRWVHREGFPPAPPVESTR